MSDDERPLRNVSTDDLFEEIWTRWEMNSDDYRCHYCGRDVSDSSCEKPYEHRYQNIVGRLNDLLELIDDQ